MNKTRNDDPQPADLSLSTIQRHEIHITNSDPYGAKPLIAVAVKLGEVSQLTGDDVDADGSAQGPLPFHHREESAAEVDPLNEARAAAVAGPRSIAPQKSSLEPTVVSNALSAPKQLPAKGSREIGLGSAEGNTVTVRDVACLLKVNMDLGDNIDRLDDRTICVGPNRAAKILRMKLSGLQVL
ncbi:unnamed protein product [Zymoseptoria tritici ST99CH_3D1]|nr:unnamed protein product [Zymoseptoria tritici ST99CH_3D1]